MANLFHLNPAQKAARRKKRQMLRHEFDSQVQSLMIPIIQPLAARCEDDGLRLFTAFREIPGLAGDRAVFYLLAPKSGETSGEHGQTTQGVAALFVDHVVAITRARVGAGGEVDLMKPLLWSASRRSRTDWESAFNVQVSEAFRGLAQPILAQKTARPA